MYSKLNTSKIVITGITGGIARATAVLARQQGAEIIVTARSQQKLDEALKDLGTNVTGYVLDVSKADDVKQFFDDVGPFDHLVTPAASSMFAPISDLDLETARELVDSKQWGQLYCVKYAIPYLDKSGSITLFSGTVTQKALPGATMFAAAGAATEASARIWALELAPVRVNTIVPGIIETPVWTNLMGDDGAKEQLQHFADTLPVGRIGAPDDIAKSVLYLMDNGFVSGTSLVVDGGHRLI